MIPDSISADLFGDTPFTIGISVTNVMWKFLCLGVGLEDVVRRTTVNPARMIGRPVLGTLSVGSAADIAVLEVMKGRFAYLRSGGGKIVGHQRLQAVLSMFGGRILYDHPYGLSVPRRRDIPKDSRYWADSTEQNW